MPDNKRVNYPAWAEQALRDALRSLDVPAVSADFDARVLSAIRGRSPWWDLFLSHLRPAFATATVSAAVTAVILAWPVKPAPPVMASAPVSAQAMREGDQRIERVLESPQPTYGVLMPLRHDVPQKAAPPANRWKLRWPGA